MLKKDLEELMKYANLPDFGPIDFDSLYGMSFVQALNHLQKERHILTTRWMSNNITFDEIAIDAHVGSHIAIIDDYYKLTHNVELRPYTHGIDANNVHTFSEMQPVNTGTYFSPKWHDPHVFAVADVPCTPAENFSLSPPNVVNVGTDVYSGMTELFNAGSALKVSFLKGACHVSIDTDFRIHWTDKGKPINNWQRMFAYDKNDNLIAESTKWGGMGTLSVSDWSGNIAYVMITIDHTYTGITPLAIFDNLSWTTIEYVVLVYYMMRFTSAISPVKGAHGASRLDAIIKKVDAIIEELERKENPAFNAVNRKSGEKTKTPGTRKRSIPKKGALRR